MSQYPHRRFLNTRHHRAPPAITLTKIPSVISSPNSAPHSPPRNCTMSHRAWKGMTGTRLFTRRAKQAMTRPRVSTHCTSVPGSGWKAGTAGAGRAGGQERRHRGMSMSGHVMRNMRARLADAELARNIRSFRHSPKPPPGPRRGDGCGRWEAVDQNSS